MLTRHGTKYPSETIINDITNKLVSIIQNDVKLVYSNKKNLDMLEEEHRKIIEGIMNWENVIAQGTDKELNEEGKQAMMNFGKRLKMKFKAFADKLQKNEIDVNAIVNKNDFLSILQISFLQVLSAVENRCIVSAKKFLTTFYEQDHDDILVVKCPPNDTRIKVCNYF